MERMSISWSESEAYRAHGEPDAPAKHRLVRAALGVLTVLPMLAVLLWTLVTMGKWKGVGLSAPESPDPSVSPETNAERSVELWKFFNLHPICMTLAFSCLFGEALLVFRFLPASWRARKLVHASLQLGAAVFASIGIGVVVTFKTQYHQEHLYSVHSWLGLTTYTLFMLQFTVGAVFLLRPRWFVSFFPAHESYVRTVLPWHIVAGQSIYFLAIISLVSGVQGREILLELQVSTPALDLYGARFIFGNIAAILMAVVAYAVFVIHSNARNSDDRDDGYVAM